MQSRNRGKVAAAISGLLAVGMLGACGMSASEPGSASDTLRVVLQREPTTLNPTFSPLSDSRAWGGIFDSLVGMDRQTLQPTKDGLLTDWEQTSDTEWTFKVREGVKFHNGEDFNAEAAIFTLANP